MTAIEARQVLTAGLGQVSEPTLAKVFTVTGRWPVLLGIVNGVARTDLRAAVTADQALLGIVADFEERGITVLDPSVPESREKAVSATIAVGLDRVSTQERELFEQLAVFGEDVDIPLPVLARYWMFTSNWSPAQTRGTVRAVADLSLFADHRLEEPGSVRLHDVVRQYLRSRVSSHLHVLDTQIVDAHRDLGASTA